MAMGEALGSRCFLDPAFIQGIENQPTKKQLEPMDEEEVPTIDLSNYNDSGSPNQVVRELGIACEKWGFFQVINHGVPMELLGRIEKAAKLFFDQTAEEKRKVKRSIGGSYNDAMRLGFKEEENTQNVRDWKEVFEFLVKDEILIPASHQPNDTKLRQATGSGRENKDKEEMQKLLLPFFILIFLSSSSQTRGSILLHHHSQSNKSHFVLVHGACLGAWSWYKVTTLLQAAGHNVTALDMAAQGINQLQPESVGSLTEYFQPLLSFMEALPSDEKIVLVGHSLGGLGISMAMERFPEKISAAIFVTAAMPGPILRPSSKEEQKRILGMYRAFYTEEESKASNSTNLFLFSQQQLETKLFPLSPPEDIALATTLVRPQPTFGLVGSMKELALSGEKYGSVKRAFIISRKDEMTTELMVWAMLTFNKPDLVAEVEGSDHMVMASKPLQLAQQLSIIAQDFAAAAASSSSTY